MQHPPYHLRPNKAVDRLLFAELLRWLDNPQVMEEGYTYYGFGGPYLEDFRLIHECFPAMEMVSIEKSAHTYKRQLFHQPCTKVALINTDFNSFLSRYDPKDKPGIFWLDNTGLKLSHFVEFISLLEKVPENSIVKLTLECEVSNYIEEDESTAKQDDFKRKYEAYLPAGTGAIPAFPQELADLFQKMVQIAAEKALPANVGFVFQPLSSFYYDDATGMFTLAGIVCNPANQPAIKKKFKGWKFGNLNWAKPKEINVPHLSTKERLHFQAYLPGDATGGTDLYATLGYNIGKTKAMSVSQLQQYSEFCRYYPHFIKAIP